MADSQACRPEHGILVIDDEPVLRMTFKHLLEGQGYKIWLAENGNEGLQVFKEKQPDLVITDMVMPEVDGFQTIQSLRELDPDLPIIAMSAFIEPSQMDRPLDSGAFCYVTKPVEMSVLYELIRAILLPAPDLGSQSEESPPK